MSDDWDIDPELLETIEQRPLPRPSKERRHQVLREARDIAQAKSPTGAIQFPKSSAWAWARLAWGVPVLVALVALGIMWQSDSKEKNTTSKIAVRPSLPPVEPILSTDPLKELDDRMSRARALIHVNRPSNRAVSNQFQERRTFTLLIQAEELNEQIKSQDG